MEDESGGCIGIVRENVRRPCRDSFEWRKTQPRVVAGAAPAGKPPVADAGPDLEATEGETVTLRGAGQPHPDDVRLHEITGYPVDNLAYEWERLGTGSMVTLTGADTGGTDQFWRARDMPPGAGARRRSTSPKPVSSARLEAVRGFRRRCNLYQDLLSVINNQTENGGIQTPAQSVGFLSVIDGVDAPPRQYHTVAGRRRFPVSRPRGRARKGCVDTGAPSLPCRRSAPPRRFSSSLPPPGI